MTVIDKAPVESKYESRTLATLEALKYAVAETYLRVCAEVGTRPEAVMNRLLQTADSAGTPFVQQQLNAIQKALVQPGFESVSTDRLAGAFLVIHAGWLMPEIEATVRRGDMGRVQQICRALRLNQPATWQEAWALAAVFDTEERFAWFNYHLVLVEATVAPYVSIGEGVRAVP